MDEVKGQRSQTLNVTPTGYALLGLLAVGGELSGYELRQWAANSIGLWYATPAQSQIYRELDKLDGAELVVANDVSQEKRPDKRTYQITDDGRAALHDWAATAPVPAPALKHHALLRLFASSTTPDLRHRLADILTEHRTHLYRVLDELESQAVALEDDQESELGRLVAIWAAEIHRGDLRGTELVLEALDVRPDQQTSQADEPTNRSARWTITDL